MKRWERIVTILIFSTLFFSSYVLTQTPFEFYITYVVVIALLPFWILKYKIPSSIIFLFLILLITGLINVLYGNNTLLLFIKIYSNLLVFTLFYYYVLFQYDLDVIKLFGFYCKGALVVTIIGVVQIISYVIGFKYGYDYSFILNKWGVIQGGIVGIRVNSIFSEPSYFGASIAPAFFVSVYNLIRKKNLFFSKIQSITIIVVYMLTYSTVAYAGIFITVILLLVNFGFVRYAMLALIIILSGYNYLYKNISEFRLRIDGVNSLYSGEVTSAFEVHGSSFVQYNNFHIAKENFYNFPLFGTGLGSHTIAYDKYSLTKKFGGIYDFNKSDANSMAVRLMSETGFFGLIFIFIFIIKNYVKNDHENEENNLWIISNATLVIIILQLLRQGNYTYNGFIFYMWLYYFTRVANQKLIDN